MVTNSEPGVELNINDQVMTEAPFIPRDLFRGKGRESTKKRNLLNEGDTAWYKQNHFYYKSLDPNAYIAVGKSRKRTTCGQDCELIIFSFYLVCNLPSARFSLN